MPGVSHGFEAWCLFFLLDVVNGECLLYEKLIFPRNKSKDKSGLFLYFFMELF